MLAFSLGAAPGTVSAANGSALAPTNLSVDDRSDPLDVTGPPQFDWLPQDASGDEIQTAYEIVVHDALSGALVWDSGEVASTQQSYVPYGGPALADSREYSWTVRTWDREGNVGPYAQDATFDAGITDSEWSGAEWIRRVTTGNDLTVDYTLARRQFSLNDPARVTRARAYIASEGVWQLHVNGQIIDTQYDYQAPGETYYDAEDITAQAQQAQQAGGGAAHQLAVGVEYAAWATTEGEPRMEGPVAASTTLSSASNAGDTTVSVGATTYYAAGENLGFDTPGSTTFEVATIKLISGSTITLSSGLKFAHASGASVVAENGPSGLLVKVVVDHADGAEEDFVSDGSWLVTKDTEEVNSTPTLRSGENAGTYIEYLDRRLAIPGWDTAGFAPSSAWVAATVMGAHPLVNPASCADYLSAGSPCGFTHLIPMQSSLSYTLVHPASVRTLADGTVTADFGTALVGTPVVSLNAGVAGDQMTLTASYRYNNTTTVAAAPAGTSTISVTNVCGFSPGDTITIDAPADGYGAGNPEVRTVASTTSSVSCSAGTVASDCGTLTTTITFGSCPEPGTISLGQPLSSTHAPNTWVEGSRAGTSTLDTQDTNLSFSYTEADGAQTTDFYVGEGFRYLQVSNAGEPLTAAQIWVLATHEDATPGQAATFSSSNVTLNSVFQLMQRSALYAGQEEFNDSPDRQDGQFLMDGIDESMATTESLDERSLTREMIQNMILSQQRYWLGTGGSTTPSSASSAAAGTQYGEVNAVYPDGDGKRDIPDFTEGFPEEVWHYYLMTGDAQTLAQAYPTLQNIATYITDNIATSGGDAGLIYQLDGGGTGVPGESLFPGQGSYEYGIVDWPPPMRYNTTVLNAGVDTVVNARAVEVYRAAAAAAQVLGHSADATTYTAAMTSLIGAINAKLIEPSSGLYDDGLTPDADQQIGNASEHDQSFAVDYGIAPASAYASLGSYITTQGMMQGPMDLGQLEQALIDVNRPDTLVSILTNPSADGPAKILAENGTSMWELWDPGCSAPGGSPGDNTSSCTGAAIVQSSSDSFSHGWGSVGVVGILRGLLGLTITGPGAATIQIAPPGSGLASASGSEWTERGPVDIAWASCDVSVDVPDNVEASVSIPDPSGATYYDSGAGQPQFLGFENGNADFSTGSGASLFSCSPTSAVSEGSNALLAGSGALALLIGQLVWRRRRSGSGERGRGA